MSDKPTAPEERGNAANMTGKPTSPEQRDSGANTPEQSAGIEACSGFPIVGIGASAGGLEAITQLLE